MFRQHNVLLDCAVCKSEFLRDVTPFKSTSYTLLNLGSQYPVPREQWGVLTDRIDDILHHQTSLFSLESDIETEAQRIAKKLIGRNREYVAIEEQARSDYRTVNVPRMHGYNEKAPWVT